MRDGNLMMELARARLTGWNGFAFSSKSRNNTQYTITPIPAPQSCRSVYIVCRLTSYDCKRKDLRVFLALVFEGR